MLTIICGDDTRTSRAYFQKLKEQYRIQGYEIKNLSNVQFESLREQMTESASLFAPKQIYFTEHLVRSLKLKRNKELLKNIDSLIKYTDNIWFDWEQYTAREITNPKSAQIKEFAVPTSIFKLLDQCYPGNLQNFLNEMTILLDTQEAGFVYAMLCKHIRSLILAKSNALPAATSPWHRKKLSAQASVWPLDKLISFYEGLTRLDVSIKTSNNPHGIKKSIDIMACYVL